MDYLPPDLVNAADVALLRPPSALWGYNAQVTDEALNRIAQVITERATWRSRCSASSSPSSGQPPAAPGHRRYPAGPHRGRPVRVVRVPGGELEAPREAPTQEAPTQEASTRETSAGQAGSPRAAAAPPDPPSPGLEKPGGDAPGEDPPGNGAADTISPGSVTPRSGEAAAARDD